MLKRSKTDEIIRKLEQFPAVAILGCRQVGKTTLALQISKKYKKEVIYLDLERVRDRAQLEEPDLFLEKQEGKLLILDEIHLVPEIFAELRGIIDRRRKKGEKSGHFLILGSASPELLKQSSESLAGRIAYVELDPLAIVEAKASKRDDYMDRLWVRGGFPDSFLADSDETSLEWRENFIRTYLKRDLPDLGHNLPAELVYRLWRMLAIDQGSKLDLTKLAGNLAVSTTTIRNYLDTLADLFLVRQLRPWYGNTKKRLVKTPKIYVRDSGILHALIGIKDYNDLSSHPIYGISWEGFVIEQILQIMPYRTEATFYGSSAGAEIDLILETPDKIVYAIEIKRTVNPKISKGFRLACDEIKPDKRFYVIPTEQSFPMDKETTAIGVEELIETIKTP
ncbi:MAG: ATP-binding protein [Pseudomonadota bacterium]